MSTELQNFIIEGIRFILTHNYFNFNGTFFLQSQGMAIGTRFAPSYANLFLAHWEEHIPQIAGANLVLWQRYIDDILFIWKGTEDSFNTFCSSLNSNQLNIKLTYETSEVEGHLLDLNIYIENGTICTKNFVKPTDTNSHIPITSSHHKNWIKGTPKGQFLRIKRNCTLNTVCDTQIQEKKLHFLQKGYSNLSLEQTIESLKEHHNCDPCFISLFCALKKVVGNWRRFDLSTQLAQSEMKLIYDLDSLEPGGLNIDFELKWFL